MKVILTLIISSLIAAAFVAVVIVMIINKKKGKHSCSCGGNCGACPIGCPSATAKK